MLLKTRRKAVGFYIFLGARDPPLSHNPSQTELDRLRLNQFDTILDYVTFNQDWLES